VRCYPVDRAHGSTLWLGTVPFEQSLLATLTITSPHIGTNACSRFTMASIAPTAAQGLQQRVSASRGTRLVPQCAMSSAAPLRFQRSRRTGLAVVRRSATGLSGRRAVVPVYATSALQTLGTTLLQKASKATKSPLFVAGEVWRASKVARCSNSCSQGAASMCTAGIGHWIG
jgi:hypothetical protein